MCGAYRFPFTDEEQKLVSGYIFLTRKPMILILNVGEEQLFVTDGNVGAALWVDAGFKSRQAFHIFIILVGAPPISSSRKRFRLLNIVRR